MRQMNFTSGPPPYIPSDSGRSVPSNENKSVVVDLGALNYMPCKPATYLPLTNDFLSLYLEALFETDDVDIGKRLECRVLLQTASRVSHTLTESEWYKLNTLVDRLPKSLVMQGVHYGDDYRRMLLQFYSYVYSVEPVSTGSWRRYANEVDKPSTNLYPEERLNITCLLEDHAVEIENAVYREAGQLHSVQMNPLRVNYVSFKSLRDEALAVEKRDFSKSRGARDFLVYKIEQAKEQAALTDVQLAILLDQFRVV